MVNLVKKEFNKIIIYPHFLYPYCIANYNMSTLCKVISKHIISSKNY